MADGPEKIGSGHEDLDREIAALDKLAPKVRDFDERRKGEARSTEASTGATREHAKAAAEDAAAIDAQAAAVSRLSSAQERLLKQAVQTGRVEPRGGQLNTARALERMGLLQVDDPSGRMAAGSRGGTPFAATDVGATVARERGLIERVAIEAASRAAASSAVVTIAQRRAQLAHEGARAGTLETFATGSGEGMRFGVREGRTGQRVSGNFASMEAASARIAALTAEVAPAVQQTAAVQRRIAVAAGRELVRRERISAALALYEGALMAQPVLPPSRQIGRGGAFDVVPHPDLFGQRDYGPRYSRIGSGRQEGARFEFGPGGYVPRGTNEAYDRWRDFYVGGGQPPGMSGVPPQPPPPLPPMPLMLERHTASTRRQGIHVNAEGEERVLPHTMAAYARSAEATEAAVDSMSGAVHRSAQEARFAAVEFGTADRSMYRHGALTTEFIQAAYRGEVTMRELGSQVALTIGKFGGWTLAASLVYGAVRAVSQLGRGAIASNSAIRELQRYIGGLNTERARNQLRGLAEEMNLPLDVVGQQFAAAGRLTSNMADPQGAAEQIARATLLLSRVGDIEPDQAMKFTQALQTGFKMSTDELLLFVDQLNQLQNRMNIPLDVSAGAVSRAAGTWRAAGGDPNSLAALVAAGRRGSGFSGEILGTTFSRSAVTSQRPGNRAALQAFGIDPDQTISQMYEQAIELVRSRRVTGRGVTELATALSTPQLAGRGVTQALLNYRDYDRALKEQEPDRARGSARRELEGLLKSWKEQIADVGNSMMQLGAALEQSGVLAPLGLMLTLMNHTLDAATSLVNVFNHLVPPGLRTGVALIAEMAAGLAVLRRFGAFRAGGALVNAFPQLAALESPERQIRGLALHGARQQLGEAERYRESATRGYSSQRLRHEVVTRELQSEIDELEKRRSGPNAFAAGSKEYDDAGKDIRQREKQLRRETEDLGRAKRETLTAQKVVLRAEEEKRIIEGMTTQQTVAHAYTSRMPLPTSLRIPESYGAQFIMPGGGTANFSRGVVRDTQSNVRKVEERLEREAQQAYADMQRAESRVGSRSPNADRLEREFADKKRQAFDTYVAGTRAPFPFGMGHEYRDEGMVSRGFGGGGYHEHMETLYHNDRDAMLRAQQNMRRDASSHFDEMSSQYAATRGAYGERHQRLQDFRERQGDQLAMFGPGPQDPFGDRMTLRQRVFHSTEYGQRLRQAGEAIRGEISAMYRSSETMQKLGQIVGGVGLSGRALQGAGRAAEGALDKASILISSAGERMRGMRGRMGAFARSLNLFDWALIAYGVWTVADAATRNAGDRTDKLYASATRAPTGQRDADRLRKARLHTLTGGDRDAASMEFFNDIIHPWRSIPAAFRGDYSTPWQRQDAALEAESSRRENERQIYSTQQRARAQGRPVPFRFLDDVARDARKLAQDYASFAISQGEYRERLDTLQTELAEGRPWGRTAKERRTMRQRSAAAVAATAAIGGDVGAARYAVRGLDPEHLQQMAANATEMLSTVGLQSRRGNQYLILAQETYRRAVMMMGGGTQEQVAALAQARTAFFESVAQGAQGDLNIALNRPGATEGDRRSAYATSEDSIYDQTVGYAMRGLTGATTKLAGAQGTTRADRIALQAARDAGNKRATRLFEGRVKGDKSAEARIGQELEQWESELTDMQRLYEQSRPERERASFQDYQEGVRSRVALRQSRTGDPVTQARDQLRGAQQVLAEARRRGRPRREIQDAQSAVNQAQTSLFQAHLQDIQAQGRLAVLQGPRDRVSQARGTLAEAKKARDYAEKHKKVHPTEYREAQSAVIEAQNAYDDALRQQAEGIIELENELAVARAHGDPMEAARRALAGANRLTRDPDETRRHFELRRALARQNAINQGQDATRDLHAAQGEYRASKSGDPRDAARSELETANQEVRDATVGTAAWYRALAHRNNARRSLQKANADMATARLELLKAGTDDPVVQARIDERIARESIRGTTGAERIRARARLREAHRNTLVASVSARSDTVDFNLAMDKITADQAASQLESLARSHGIGRQMRRDLLRRAHELRKQSEQEASGFALDVGTIKLPTIYDVKRAMAPLRQARDMAAPRFVANISMGDVRIDNEAAAEEFWGGMDRRMGTAMQANMRSAQMR